MLGLESAINLESEPLNPTRAWIAASILKQVLDIDPKPSSQGLGPLPTGLHSGPPVLKNVPQRLFPRYTRNPTEQLLCQCSIATCREHIAFSHAGGIDPRLQRYASQGLQLRENVADPPRF